MKVNITNLTFKTIIGILDFERVKPQKVVVDITFEYDYLKKTSEFVDYVKVAKTVKKTMKKQKFGLIEDAIIFLQKKINSKFNVKNLMLKISKPDILKECIVSVQN